MDKATWTAYLCSILIVTTLLILFGAIIGKYQTSITDIIVHMSMILLEPYQVALDTGFGSVKILSLVCLLMAMSFLIFYNVEFRSSIIAQDFPDDIEKLEQLDILRSGLFTSFDYKGFMFIQVIRV